MMPASWSWETAPCTRHPFAQFAGQPQTLPFFCSAAAANQVKMPVRNIDLHQHPQHPRDPFGVAQLSRVYDLHWFRIRFNGLYKQLVMVSCADHMHFFREQAVLLNNLIFLRMGKCHHRVQITASGQHPTLEVRAVLELPQVGTVAGGCRGNAWEQPACQGCDDPQVVAVDDIRLKCVHRRREVAGEGGFILVQILFGKVAEPGTRVGHDIAHAHDGKRDVRFTKSDEPAPVVVHAGQLCRPIGLDARHQEIEVSASGRFPQHGLDVDTASGGIGPLAEHVKNLQGLKRSFPASPGQPARDPPAPLSLPGRLPGFIHTGLHILDQAVFPGVYIKNKRHLRRATRRVRNRLFPRGRPSCRHKNRPTASEDRLQSHRP